MGGSCTGKFKGFNRRNRLTHNDEDELQDLFGPPINVPVQPVVDNENEDEIVPQIPQPVANQNIARRFTFSQMMVATSDFDDTNILGVYPVTNLFTKRFSKYYKGKLYENNQIVAVKKLNPDAIRPHLPLPMDYFVSEVGRKSLADHPNVVTLIGYCAEGDEKLLVYEYMPLGSVGDHLHGVRANCIALGWTARLKIAVGAARGLAYLHHEMNPPMTCRDVKTFNILLVDDEDFNVKVTDYGLVRPGPYSYCTTDHAVMGGDVSRESNMYCFGLVLLELVTGRVPYDPTRPVQEKFLVQWAEPMLKDRRRRRVLEMVDRRLEGEYPLRGIDRVVDLAARCVEFRPALRPSAAEVVAVLSSL